MEGEIRLSELLIVREGFCSNCGRNFSNYGVKIGNDCICPECLDTCKAKIGDARNKPNDEG